MKIVTRNELGHLPNGTVFSRIVDKYFYEGYNGDFSINGLNIIRGHNNQDLHNFFTEEGGHFQCINHMLEYVSTYNKQIDDTNNYIDEWDDTCDTADCDYDENEYFVVYNKSDILTIINNLTLALKLLENKGKYGRFNE